MDLLIGADPEFFVKKDGKFVSAHGLIEGTKKDPLKVEGGAVQVDGMALEININPAATFSDFENNFQSVMKNIREMVGPEYEFAFVPVADFDEEYIKNQPEEARRLGCDPDFNAWKDGKPNNPPDAAKNFRTASGHFHLGWTEDEDINNPEHLDACQMMVKQLDATIGLMGVVYDSDTRRRELYGKAGAYRPKPYGVEYRVLSNFWLSNKAIRQELFNEIGYSFDRLIDGKDLTRKVVNGYIERYINNGALYGAYSTLGHTILRSNLLHETYLRRSNELVVKENERLAEMRAAAPVKKRARKVAAQPEVIAGFGANNVIVDIEAGNNQVAWVNGGGVGWVNADPWQRDQARVAARQEEDRAIEILLNGIVDDVEPNNA